MFKVVVFTSKSVPIFSQYLLDFPHCRWSNGYTFSAVTGDNQPPHRRKNTLRGTTGGAALGLDTKSPQTKYFPADEYVLYGGGWLHVASD